LISQKVHWRSSEKRVQKRKRSLKNKLSIKINVSSSDSFVSKVKILLRVKRFGIFTKIFRDFSWENYGNGDHEHDVRKCPLGRCFLFKKTPQFLSGGSKLDQLTVNLVTYSSSAKNLIM
jgi:hypothetical protein